MVNRLKMAKINAILTLRKRGWSQQKIAEQLGIHRETVARHLAERAKPPKSAHRGAAENAPTALAEPDELELNRRYQRKTGRF